MKQMVVRKNRYVDSVTLMSIGDRILNMDGIDNAEVQMGTPANLELLGNLGYTPEEAIGSDDLVLAVSGDTKEHLEAALAQMEKILDHKVQEDGESVYRDMDEIDLAEDGYDLVQISLPGQYAYAQAKKALEKGLHVFIFSDNVSLEEEAALKKTGREKGLLVMGPDCGVGMLRGVCLGAGSIMKEGEIGIVAASGSGAQEVACLIEKCGYGISDIIGTGGRDLYPQIGGSMMLQGMKTLEQEENTKVIVLVSKLADRKVMDQVLTAADTVKKPVVVIFLGGGEGLYRGHRVIPAHSLQEAAILACKALNPGTDFTIGFTRKEIDRIVEGEIKRYNGKQKYFRGLYCGGTFTEEALLYYSRELPELTLYSNLDTGYAKKLPDHHTSIGHSILDMGAEDFTGEAPHPVFDPGLRIKRLKQELEDEELAAVLLDFITGPGVARDPITPVVEAIRAAGQGRHITYIANICGSHGDPQNIADKKKLLEDAGVIVTAGSYESARLSGALMKALEGRD